ncbi:hypothetical protein FNV43_RR09558 [Rhamnella rubrinervis]|uniref:Reverse transcriptase domain-containing protein n=1 Tax=Rhamnella rubrinervis TaxID=2594499 RepID=A0A8K0HBH6_9ROSA|nr:hypothetical protein FNV43_RR09558 [Rhamnella rubrinervis]
MAAYQQRVTKYYNTKVHPRRFRVGDYVLRKVFQNTQELNAGKLGPTWEGPYRVVGIPRPGAYTLQSLGGLFRWCCLVTSTLNLVQLWPCKERGQPSGRLTSGCNLFGIGAGPCGVSPGLLHRLIKGVSCLCGTLLQSCGGIFRLVVEFRLGFSGRDLTRLTIIAFVLAWIRCPPGGQASGLPFISFRDDPEKSSMRDSSSFSFSISFCFLELDDIRLQSFVCRHGVCIRRGFLLEGVVDLHHCFVKLVRATAASDIARGMLFRMFLSRRVIKQSTIGAAKLESERIEELSSNPRFGVWVPYLPAIGAHTVVFGGDLDQTATKSLGQAMIMHPELVQFLRFYRLAIF